MDSKHSRRRARESRCSSEKRKHQGNKRTTRRPHQAAAPEWSLGGFTELATIKTNRSLKYGAVSAVGTIPTQILPSRESRCRESQCFNANEYAKLRYLWFGSYLFPVTEDASTLASYVEVICPRWPSNHQITWKYRFRLRDWGLLQGRSQTSNLFEQRNL